MTAPAHGNVARASELARRDRWVRQHLLEGGAALPFSFKVDGEPSTAALASWERVETGAAIHGSRTERTVTWREPSRQLEVRCVLVTYQEFPTVEWTVYLQNGGSGETPILAEIQGLDILLQRSGSDEFVLHHHKGDTNGPDSYEPRVTTLGASTTLEFAPPAGRPTFGAFPYFDLAFDDGGVIVAVGWPGQWMARFDRDHATSVHVTSGQQVTSLRLRPGEVVRTPLVVLQFYEGEATRAQNLWRRWMLAHVLPRVEGELPRASLHGIMGLGPVLTEASQVACIDAWHDQGIAADTWWMDAGWYPCEGGWSWRKVGTWTPDPERFPNGVRTVAERAHERGMRFILWFEPERVSPDTWLWDEHPEWLLSGDRPERLLDLGNPDARGWLTDHIDDLIKTQGLDWYRQDCNIDPLEYWRRADEVDRRGMTENQYVQGYLAYFDELLRRNPGLRIDTCASGGRRNDLETLRRAVPLLRSDFMTPHARFVSPDDPIAPAEGNQGQSYGLASWLPYSGTIAFMHDDYDRRSHLASAMALLPKEMWEAMFTEVIPQGQIDALLSEVDWARFRRASSEWRVVADLLTADFYPLTGYSVDRDSWIAWQLDDPEAGRGLVQAFRRHAAEVDSMTFRLQGLSFEARYVVTDHDTGIEVHGTGDDLMRTGLIVRTAARPYAALFTYARA